MPDVNSSDRNMHIIVCLQQDQICSLLLGCHGVQQGQHLRCKTEPTPPPRGRRTHSMARPTRRGDWFGECNAASEDFQPFSLQAFKHYCDGSKICAPRRREGSRRTRTETGCYREMRKNTYTYTDDYRKMLFLHNIYIFGFTYPYSQLCLHTNLILPHYL